MSVFPTQGGSLIPTAANHRTMHENANPVFSMLKWLFQARQTPLTEPQFSELGHQLVGRQVEDANIHDLTSHQLFTLKIVSLVAGAVSVASVLQASFWFIRMRRSFRHDLIMVLMQSDMLKAICFMIYPAVELAHGKVPSTSKFCQASGFFLSLGIETCDFAVLLIALHTGLYISRRGQNNGLYPYRRIAFALFGGAPLLLASLSFINEPAFVNSGEYCYLPIHPSWIRRSLSWIPRYVIFVTILVTYAYIYIHVSMLMKKFGASSGRRRDSDPSSGGKSDVRKRTALVPPMPKLERHGLIPTPPPSPPHSECAQRRDSIFSAAESLAHRASSASSHLIATPKRAVHAMRGKMSLLRMNELQGPDLESQESVWDTGRRASGGSTQLVASSTMPGRAMKWKSPRFGLDAANSSNPEDHSPGGDGTTSVRRGRRRSAPAPLWIPVEENEDIELQAMETPEVMSNDEPTVQDAEAQAAVLDIDVQSTVVELNSDTSTTSPETPRNYWNRPFYPRRRSSSLSFSNIFAILRRGPLTSSTKTSSSVFLSPTELEATGMAEARENIRRQARMLFIYPFVYLLVWLVPFIYHIQGETSGKRPFGVIVMSLLSLAIQGFADALVFSFRERPWKQSRRDHRAYQMRIWGQDCHDNQTPHVGRTPDEMLVDSRIARRRLNEEIEQRRSERMDEGTRNPKDWWEAPPARGFLSHITGSG